MTEGSAETQVDEIDGKPVEVNALAEKFMCCMLGSSNGGYLRPQEWDW